MQSVPRVIASVAEGKVGRLVSATAEDDVVGGARLGGDPLKHLVAVVGYAKLCGCCAGPLIYFISE